MIKDALLVTKVDVTPQLHQERLCLKINSSNISPLLLVSFEPHIVK